MGKGFFVTGTDTGVGKTVITAALIQSLAQQGFRVAGMKPVASGAEKQDGILVNDDALTLQGVANVAVTYDMVNPYVFVDPVSPNLAARHCGVRIDLDRIRHHYAALAEGTDFVMVEGVGGWRVPLNESQAVSDMAATLDLPVILVVGMRLGCLNHAILTYESMMTSGARCLGWIANIMEAETRFVPEMIETLQRRINANLLGIVPPLNEHSPTRVMEYLDTSFLVHDKSS